MERDSQVRSAAGSLAGGSLVLAAFGTLAVIALSVIPLVFQPLWLMILASLLVLGAAFLGFAGHPADALDNRTLAVISGRAHGLSSNTLGASHFTLPALLAAIPYLSFAGLAAVSGHHWISIATAALGWLQWVMCWRLGTRLGRRFSEQHLAREGRATLIYLLLLAVTTVIGGLWMFPWQDAVADAGAGIYQVATWIPIVNIFLAGFGGAPLIILGLNGAVLIMLWATDLILGARAGRSALYQRQYGGTTRLGSFQLAVGSATRNIALRTWISWLRDPRYQVLLGTVIVMPPLLLLPVWVGGAPVEVLRLLVVPLFAMCFGWALHNDTAYDFTALWVHVTGGLSGRADRAGRAIPTLVTGTVLCALGADLVGAAIGNTLAQVAVLAASIALLGATVGGSSIMSTLAPYPVARPGDSPFSQPVRSWGGAAFAQPMALLVEVALCLPTIYFAWQAVTLNDWSQALMAAGIGVGTAVVLVTAGILIGGRVFESRRTALLTFAQSY